KIHILVNKFLDFAGYRINLPLWKRGIEGGGIYKISLNPSFPKRGAEYLSLREFKFIKEIKAD
ncbi:MAG: hypothetical protein KAI44_09790, partial [Methylococcales bacterium]|nr:hypothetical protein [Methylococcales bacterium]